MSADRLNRIEQKLDKLTDIVASIARVEEKMVANNQRIERVEKRVGTVEKDVKEVSATVRDNSNVVRFADKLFWLLVGGAGSFIVWLLKDIL